MVQHATLLLLQLLLLSNPRSGHGFGSHPHVVIGVRESSSRSSSCLAGKRSELGASTRKIDSRSVQEWLGLSPREVERLRKPLGPSLSPRLEERLTLLADGQTDSVAGFFRVDLRASKADARSLVSRHPPLLFMPRQQAVDRCTWLVENLSLNKKQLLKMALKFPRLFEYGVEASYAPLVEWFRSYLGLNTREVARLMVRLPQLFSLTPDGNVEKSVRFLESLGLSLDEVSKMVLLHPEIFSYSVEEKVIPMLEWLQTELRAPPQEVIQMVARYPSLLGCSPTKNLAPKFDFFREVLKASVPEIRDAVVTTPSLLGYSLDSRICPRATRLLERGVNPTFSEHRWLLTATSPKRFEEWITANTGTRR
eukprot:g18022.t1